LLALGGALGTVARTGVGRRRNAVGQTFPWAQLSERHGSFVIGFFATLTGPDGRSLVGGSTRQFVMIGCAADTRPFGPFSLQTRNLMTKVNGFTRGETWQRRSVLCLVSVWLGAVAPRAQSAKGA